MFNTAEFSAYSVSSDKQESQRGQVLAEGKEEVGETLME